jgi:hypothetical protein
MGARPSAFARSALITTTAAAPSFTGGVAGRDAAVLLERGLQRAQRFRRSVRAHRLVAVEHQRVALLLRNGDGQHLGRERARGVGGGRLLVALHRELVLFVARHLERVGHGLAGVAHVPVLEGTPQAVENHRVDHLAVSHSQALAHAGEQVGRVAHRLHTAGDRDLDVTGLDALVSQHHGLEAGAAHLVDGEGSHVLGEPGLERGLARRSLALAARDDVAHDALVHRGRVDAGALDGLGDDHGAEGWRGEAFRLPRNLPVGRRTALTMTASTMTGDSHFDEGVRPEERVEPRTDEPERSPHFPGSHRTFAVMTSTPAHRCAWCTAHGRPHRRAPREPTFWRGAGGDPRQELGMIRFAGPSAEDSILAGADIERLAIAD